MSLYVLRYGTERGNGDYVTPLGQSPNQTSAHRMAKRIAKLAAKELRGRHPFTGPTIRLVRLRPRRTLIGYVVRLDGPGEEPRWVSIGYSTSDVPSCRVVYPARVVADSVAGGWRGSGIAHARVVPVYLRVRP